jgi:KipI family sensor histidine kinase inhibitor
MPLLPYGERAVLIEVTAGAAGAAGAADVDAVLAVQAALAGDPPAGLVELVPGATSVLAVFVDAAARRDAVGRLEGAEHGGPTGEVRDDYREAPGSHHGSPVGDEAEVTIAVRYDGADLDDVAARVGLSVDDVVARHTAAAYRVAFCGFAPGFSYLVGLDPRLHVPRLVTPRTRVPTGSVAIAGPHTAVYPRPSPGGWSLLGRTDHPVWDVERDPPTLLAPGTRVRFVAVDG